MHVDSVSTSDSSTGGSWVSGMAQGSNVLVAGKHKLTQVGGSAAAEAYQKDLYQCQAVCSEKMMPDLAASIPLDLCSTIPGSVSVPDVSHDSKP